jgi:L,D-transpeptidase ErfK/SrfK
MDRLGNFALALMLGIAALPVQGASFPWPAPGSNIVGHIQTVTVNAQNTLLDVARHFDLGYEEITAANPGVSVWLPGAGTTIVIPTEFILPPKPWSGIVINIAQRRLYYFPKPAAHAPRQIITYPIGIARPGWATPLGQTRIIGKFKDPSWIVPKSILEEQLREGEPRFPAYFPPGPRNPMGMLAMETGFAKIFIHGTNRPWGVGLRSSHGCLHLYPEDAADLFPRVTIGTPVRVIDEPYLVGKRDGMLYVSSHEPVGVDPGGQSGATRAVAAVAFYSKHYGEAAPGSGLDWDRLLAIVAARRNTPEPIGVGAPSFKAITSAIKPQLYDYAPYGLDGNDAALPVGQRRID